MARRVDDKIAVVTGAAGGIVDTPLLDRFPGRTEEVKLGMAATSPLNRPYPPEQIAGGIPSFASGDAAVMAEQAPNMDGGRAFAEP